MINDIVDKFKMSSFALSVNSGCAYDGSMIDTVLNHLCVIAYHINDDAFVINSYQLMMHVYLKVNPNILIRVLLLQHISKADMFIS